MIYERFSQHYCVLVFAHRKKNNKHWVFVVGNDEALEEFTRHLRRIGYIIDKCTKRLIHE